MATQSKPMILVTAPGATQKTDNHRYIVRVQDKSTGDRDVKVDILLDGSHDHLKRANSLVQKQVPGYFIPFRDDWFDEYEHIPF